MKRNQKNIETINCFADELTAVNQYMEHCEVCSNTAMECENSSARELRESKGVP
jgi:bacterioferritin (cytochrome b1)